MSAYVSFALNVNMSCLVDVQLVKISFKMIAISHIFAIEPGISRWTNKLIYLKYLPCSWDLVSELGHKSGNTDFSHCSNDVDVGVRFLILTLIYLFIFWLCSVCESQEQVDR